MRWTRVGCRRLPRWAVVLVTVIGASILIYLLLCLFLAVYLWFNTIVFYEVGMSVPGRDLLFVGSGGLFPFLSSYPPNVWRRRHGSAVYPDASQAI